MVDQRAGVLLLGYVRSETGLGAVARSLLPIFEVLDEPTSVVERSLGDPLLRADHPFRPAGTPAPTTPDVAVVVENADSIVASFASGDLTEVGDRARVAYFCWEVDRFPPALVPPSGLIDEIWTLSAHAARAIRPMVEVPVVAVPPVIGLPSLPPRPRSDLGLHDEEFVVLFTFDARPGAMRKNPDGAIEAYRRAFGADDGCRLVVKCTNADSHPELRESLHACARDRADIELRDGYVTAAEQTDLIASCDVYLSLHRAEGFGFTMAEAMAAGRPVVATAWSGNLEYMTDETARLVACHLVDVPRGAFPWPVDGCRWAEPDLDDAAAALRALRADPDAARALGERARAAIEARHSARARAGLVAARLGDLRQRRARSIEMVAPLRAAVESPVPLRGRRPTRVLQRWLDRAQRPRRDQLRASQRAAVEALAERDRARRARESARALDASMNAAATAVGGGRPGAGGDAAPT